MRAMSLRALFRRSHQKRPEPINEHTSLSEADVRKLQRVQRAGPKTVRVLRRR
jgi:hypothetical protein